MKQIARMIASIVREPESEEIKTQVKREVAEMTEKFPLYAHRLKEGKQDAISAS